MKSFLVWCLLAVVILASIHVRPESSREVYIKIGQQGELDFPDFDFSYIYSRQIRHVNPQQQEFAMDDLCKEANPSIDVHADLSYIFGIPSGKSKAVTFDFEDIKKRKGVLDSIVIDKIFTYVALENATLWVFQKADKLTLKLLQTMTFPDTTEINYGEFHTVPETNKLLFITESNMYLIGDMDISKIDGYRPSSQSFSGAVAINSRYLAIGSVSLGVTFYEILSDRFVKQAGGYAAAFFNRQSIQVKDVAYHANSSTLFILDSGYGVYMARLNVSAQGRISMTLLPQGYRKRDCDNMLFIDGELYLTCRDFIRIGVFTDNLTTKLESPLFKVMKMSHQGNMMVLVGYNELKIYHNDRVVDDFGYYAIDEFMLVTNQTFVAVSEYVITYGRFEVTPPIIRCHTNNPDLEGIVPAIIHTEAECNQTYFKKYNIDIEYKPIDTCIYTTPVNIIFWEPKDLTLIPFAIVSFMLVVVVIAVFIWSCLVKRKELHLKQLLRGYRSVNDYSSKPKYDNMVEEKQEKQVEMVPQADKNKPPPTPVNLET